MDPSPTCKRPPAWLRALGEGSLPASCTIAGRTYRLDREFKHDFFAATARYVGDDGAIVLKVGRAAPLFGLPMSWAGRLLEGHESRLYRLAQGIPGVPEFVGDWGPTGFAHRYVEGRPIRADDRLDDEFFPGLSRLLDALHSRGIAYVDLEKRENILLGDDGLPHLIDFQIAWHWPANRGGSTAPARWLLRMLQSSDRYHLMKHWRRLRRDQLPPDAEHSHRAPFWIRWHRLLFRPLTLLRRQVLVWLGERKSIRVRSPG